MKFGDTIYRRSVPQWAAYNVNYNEIKRLIKERTSTGLAVPVSIPNASSNNRWADLEDDLFDILKQQYDNISLFLKSKYGEIDRRLTYLEKQVRGVQKASELSHTNLSLQGRRYHKLLGDAESIGHDIQNLTRFTAVQKTAFRKILKKYRKWTGSTSLQARVETEIVPGQLSLDYANPLDRLAAQRKVLTELLQRSLRKEQLPGSAGDRIDSPSSLSISTVADINDAEKKGPVALDAALATIPFGKSSGSATYWIHPDNFDEAQALLLRHVREVHKASEISRESSSLSVISGNATDMSNRSALDASYTAYFDNVQRFLQDTSTNKSSKVALTGRWCQNPEAVVTLSNLAPWNPLNTVIDVRRKDIFKALSRQREDVLQKQKNSTNSDNIQRVQGYLLEHRDVKPLAQARCSRSRYVGTANSSKVGIWAILDADVVISPFPNDDADSLDTEVESGEAFPYAILEIRWEFSHTPEVVRAFDTTHLAEKVRDFTLESAAVHVTNKQLQQPSWKSLLEKDIRKVPITTKSSTRSGSISRGRIPVAGTSSGTSSTDGPTESVFSIQNVQSSATSVDSPNTSTRDLTLPTASKLSFENPRRKKKKARINAPSPPLRPDRYWNEFDDGDEDVNPEEAYAIYVDPNESFPGAETVSKALGAMYKSLEGASSRVASMFSLKQLVPLKKKKKKQSKSNEWSRLLNSSSRSNSDEADSSDSDTTPTEEHVPTFGTFTQSKSHAATISTASRSAATSLYRPKQILTPRQKALERTYFMFYTGLITLSYILLFVSGVLLSAGRRRAYIEVDIATIAGIATAEVCAVLSLVFLWMRKTPLSIIHWGIVDVAVVGIFVVGIAEVVRVINRSIHK